MRLNFPSSLRNFPSSLFARMALILLAGLLSAQLLSSWLQWKERANVVSIARGLNFADRIAETVRALETQEPSQRAATTSKLESADLRVALLDADQVSSNVPRGQILASIAARLGGEREIRTQGNSGGRMLRGNSNLPRHAMSTRIFDVRLNDGQWIRITLNPETETPALPGELIAQLLITLLIITAVVMLAVRQATQPLKQLAQAADQLGRDLDAPPLAETGPAETRQAAQAFNRMQERIKRLIDERARALAAVSHDLRTPLTRLRLRSELVEDEKLREQMAADLEAMAAMLNATLDYLRGLQDNEEARPIDINALLQSLANDAEILGKRMTIEGAAQAPFSGRLLALRRALQNLIDNAIKYGHSAHLRIDDDAAQLSIAVEDAGPGIPTAELAQVTLPYYRPDASRSRETGGVGLGLSIVKDIALIHGGELRLANRPQGGLCAMLVLPRKPI